MPMRHATRRSGLAASVLMGSLVAAGHPAANAVATAPSNLTIVTVHRLSVGASLEVTEYIQTDRYRVETREARSRADSRHGDGSPDLAASAPVATITRCDLRQLLTLDMGRREYRVEPFADPRPAKDTRTAASASPRPATVMIETTTVDTGERRPAFGHTARHVITARRQVPLEGSLAAPQETETDGWYIDLDARATCDRSSGITETFLTIAQPGQPIDIPMFREIGARETGFAIEQRTTSRMRVRLPDNTLDEHTSSSSKTVALLSSEPIDPALFDVPSGFRDVTPWSIRLLNVWRRVSGWFTDRP